MALNESDDEAYFTVVRELNEAKGTYEGPRSKHHSSTPLTLRSVPVCVT